MSTKTTRIAVRALVIALAAGLAHAAAADELAPGASGGAANSVATAAPRIKSRPLAAPGKPVAPIAIGYEFSARPQLGVPFAVQIVAEGGDGVAELTLSVRAGSGLEAGTPQLTTNPADGARRSWTLTATAFDEGSLYLDVLVQGTAGDQHPARNLVIPVRIGSTAQQETNSAQPVRDSSTERVIILPADRTP